MGILQWIILLSISKLHENRLRQRNFFASPSSLYFLIVAETPQYAGSYWHLSPCRLPSSTWVSCVNYEIDALLACAVISPSIITELSRWVDWATSHACMHCWHSLMISWLIWMINWWKWEYWTVSWCNGITVTHYGPNWSIELVKEEYDLNYHLSRDPLGNMKFIMIFSNPPDKTMQFHTYGDDIVIETVLWSKRLSYRSQVKFLDLT